jgi:hypothetical protein
MANAENAKLQYEGGQTATPMTALTDLGDATIFNSGASLWSKRSGFAPVVRPDGLATGGAVSVAVSGSNNVVDVAALTAYVGGALQTIAGQTDVSITRGLTTDTHNITSITVTSAGTVVAVSGTDGTSFSETRGADGGPPYIATTSIEIAQIRTTSVAAAPVAASEIFQVVGVHQERTDFPLYEIDYLNGNVEFSAALSPIHTGDAIKKVFASYAEPIFTDVAKSSDFTPSENSFSLNSTQIYGTTLGSTSSTLNQASFTAYLDDGVTDNLVSLKGESLWFRFYPDRYKTAHILEQGKLGISRTFPAGDEIQASCTISTSEAGTEKAA